MMESREKEALAFDVSVLKALLERNGFNHGRTLYFQRISLVLRSLKRFEILGLSTEIKNFHEEVERFCSLLKQEQWDCSQQKEELDFQEHLISDWNRIELRITHDIPKVLSRIDYATSALFAEVSRGFFLPFCAVALASLSRIQVLIKRLGRNASSECLTFATRLSVVFWGKSKRFSTEHVQETLFFSPQHDADQVRHSIEDQYLSATRDQTLKSLGLSHSSKSDKRSLKQGPNPSPAPTSAENVESTDAGSCIVPLPAKKSHKSVEQDGDNTYLHDEFDTNMKLVKGIQALKSNKETGTVRHKRNHASGFSKKNPMMRRKRDFFDNLFGT